MTADALVRGWDEAPTDGLPPVVPGVVGWIDITHDRQSLLGQIGVAEPAGLLAQSPQGDRHAPSHGPPARVA